MTRSAKKSALKKFGQRIAAIRKTKGLSQEKCALQVGFERAYMGKLERGERDIRLTNLIKLAKGLGVSVQSLVKDML